MPSAESILAALTAIANQWRGTAVFWHVWVAVLLLAISVRRDLSNRLIGVLLVPPLLSVSALAWASHNPFNGVAFAVLSLVLATIAHRLPGAPIQFAPWPWKVAGAVFVVFGWTYPHFLIATHWSEFLIAAPLGLLPCPTLSVVAGLTIVVSGFRSTGWTLAVSALCFAYAAIGVFRLHVAMDAGLLAAAVTLASALVISPWRRSAVIGQQVVSND